MNNFGVIEVASARTTNAPGWAYVPDTGPASMQQQQQQQQPSNRKRARNQPAALSLGDQSARQESKIRKELEALDRDGHRDASIAIPAKSRVQSKHTPNARRILTSQKTFANHLDDFHAWLALNENNPSAALAAVIAPVAAAVTTSASSSSSAAKRSGSAARRKTLTETPQPQPQEQEDVTMTDADADTEDSAAVDTPKPSPSSSSLPADITAPSDLLTPYTKPPPKSHPGDSDPLLASLVPPVPTDEELRALLAAPPLTYLEARARWPSADEGDGDDGRGGRPGSSLYPVRTFCGVCGYWGRVKCMKCGARVCALDCLDVHREECITRYGL